MSVSMFGAITSFPLLHQLVGQEKKVWIYMYFSCFSSGTFCLAEKRKPYFFLSIFLCYSLFYVPICFPIQVLHKTNAKAMDKNKE